MCGTAFGEVLHGNAVNGTILNDVDEERDHGVNVHRSLKIPEQVNKNVKRHTGCLLLSAVTRIQEQGECTA